MAADRGMGSANPAAAKKNYARALKIAKRLPGVEASTGHGWPDIKVHGKQLGGVRSDGMFLLACASRDAKDFLLETQPEAFWQAPHYVTSPWCIVRMDEVDDEQLFVALEAAWREKAPKKVVAEYLASKPAAKIAPKASAKKASPKKPNAKAPTRAPKDHFARVVKIASKLPDVEVGTSYGTPSLKAKKKFLCRIKEGTDGESLVVIAGNQDEKEFLLENEPKIFWQTPHYEGHNGLLAHLSKIDDERLFALIEAQWKRQATKKMLAEHESAGKTK